MEIQDLPIGIIGHGRVDETREWGHRDDERKADWMRPDENKSERGRVNWELAKKLIAKAQGEKGEEIDVSGVNLEDIIPGNSNAYAEYRKLLEVFRIFLPEEVKSLDLLEAAKMGKTVRVRVDMGFSRSEKARRLLRDNEGKGKAVLRRLWADKESVIVIYPASKNRPARMRIFGVNDEEITADISDISIAEWERILVDSDDQPVVFPRRFDNKARGDWARALGALQIGDSRLTTNNIYFSGDLEFAQLYGKLIGEARKKKGEG